MSWRAALPRVGICEASELPVVQLAESLGAAGERVAALLAYRELLRGSPDDPRLLRALAAILGRLGRDEECVAIHERLAVLAVAGMSLAQADRASGLAFERAVLGLGPVPAEMPRGYTAALFDAFAPSFDASLRGALQYRAPELVLAALGEARTALGAGAELLDVCDVGCGTGLLAPLLRPLARTLSGVDRSAGMLARARALGLYDALALGDLTATLASRAEVYDVVTAADVLVYVGDLVPALAAMATALRPGGLAVFTTEPSDGDGYDLAKSGRYRHAPAFVRASASAAGLDELAAEEVVLREERAQPVAGVVWVMRRSL
jgi:predicted TPR repeat methyltransferase